MFIESPHTAEELKIIPRTVRYPLLVNMLTGGETPNLPVKALERMGFKIAVYPIESLLVYAKALRDLAETLKSTGSVKSMKNRMVSFGEIKEILGLPEFLALDRKLKAVQKSPSARE